MSTCGLEASTSDIDSERVEEAVAEFLQDHCVHDDWQDDCHQEAWSALLEYLVIGTHLKDWLDREWNNHKHRSLDQLREKAKEMTGDGEAWIHDIVVTDQRLREHRARPGDPCEIAVARLDGFCPRHLKSQPLEFGKNRDYGFCEKCRFAYDLSSDAEATP